MTNNSWPFDHAFRRCAMDYRDTYHGPPELHDGNHVTVSVLGGYVAVAFESEINTP